MLDILLGLVAVASWGCYTAPPNNWCMLLLTNSGSWITGVMLEKGYSASDDSQYVTLKVRRTITITMEILDGEVTP